MAQILDIPSYENIEIAFKAYVEDDFCYKNNPNDGMRELYSQSSIKKEVKLSIKGVFFWIVRCNNNISIKTISISTQPYISLLF